MHETWNAGSFVGHGDPEQGSTSPPQSADNVTQTHKLPGRGLIVLSCYETLFHY